MVLAMMQAAVEYGVTTAGAMTRVLGAAERSADHALDWAAAHWEVLTAGLIVLVILRAYAAVRR